MTGIVQDTLGAFIAAGETPGVTGAVVTAGRTEVFRIGDSPDESTLVGVHSVTKPFTALTLMTLVREGRASLDDPVVRHLPSGTVLPEFAGTPITLRHLATHTSALPVGRAGESTLAPLRWWSPRLWRIGWRRFVTERADGPLAGVTWDDLLAHLRTAALLRAPGSLFEYSNVGLGLLGHVAGRLDGRGFETAVSGRVWQPLRLDRTRLSLPPGAARPPMYLPLGPLGAAGGAMSCVTDLATFIRFCVAPPAGPLAEALALTLPDAGADDAGRPLRLGWMAALRGPRDAYPDRWYHAGGTHTFIGFDRAARVGLVLVCAGSMLPTEALGQALLDRLAGGTAALPVPRVVAAVPVDDLDRLTGTYRLEAGSDIVMVRDGVRLVARFRRQERPAGSAVLWPESASVFFCREWDFRAAFQPDGSARIRMSSFEGLYRKEHP